MVAPRPGLIRSIKSNKRSTEVSRIIALLFGMSCRWDDSSRTSSFRPTTRSPGELIFHFLNTVVLTALVASVVLWRYRVDVLAGMGSSSGQALGIPAVVPARTVTPQPAGGRPRPGRGRPGGASPWPTWAAWPCRPCGWPCSSSMSAICP
jgi:hypothetical protein